MEQRTLVKINELEIGMMATRRNVVTREHIVAYAELSGDQNPVHLDEAFAATTQFKGVIAHGMLSAGYISAVLGNDLPGMGTVYMGQSLSFRGPVRPGDEVVTTVTVKDIVRDKRRVILTTVCKVGEKVVLDGEAMVMVAA
jgi:3-hydroxybutyryl-CoA dehydratase